ncbi:MAG: STAS/SEC14 domain-containing protein [Solirubrobacteraceae bacterium]
MPQGTLGLRVSGRVERSDYEQVLAPELRAAIAAGRVRALFVVERVDGMEPAALWADLQLFFEVAVRHRAAWERTAIVTDVAWMARAANASLGIIPGQALVYPQSQLETAKAWVASGIG